MFVRLESRFRSAEMKQAELQSTMEQLQSQDMDSHDHNAGLKTKVLQLEAEVRLAEYEMSRTDGPDVDMDAPLKNAFDGTEWLRSELANAKLELVT